MADKAIQTLINISQSLNKLQLTVTRLIEAQNIKESKQTQTIPREGEIIWVWEPSWKCWIPRIFIRMIDLKVECITGENIHNTTQSTWSIWQRIKTNGQYPDNPEGY